MEKREAAALGTGRERERLAGQGKERQCCLAGLGEQVGENATRKVGQGRKAESLGFMRE